MVKKSITHTNRGTIMSNKTKKTTTKKISKKTFENAIKAKLVEQGINVNAKCSDGSPKLIIDFLTS
tara:strand:- start:461 stop:658 length:198 start_codon:yes stop_codon:yes gene_type:complete